MSILFPPSDADISTLYKLIETKLQPALTKYPDTRYHSVRLDVAIVRNDKCNGGSGSTTDEYRIIGYTNNPELIFADSHINEHTIILDDYEVLIRCQ